MKIKALLQKPKDEGSLVVSYRTANCGQQTVNIFLQTDRGFTLIELIMAIIILSFSSMIMIPFVRSISDSPDPVIRQRAISIGQALMDEILAKKWDENSPMGGGPICSTESPDQATRPSLVDACVTQATLVAGLGSETETRVNFDDVDDYNGLSETDNFVDQNNTPLTIRGYSRSAAVDYIASNSSSITSNSPTSAVTATDTKRIVVTVTSPRGENFELVALKCNY